MRAARCDPLTAAIQPSDLLKAIQFGARGVVMKESATAPADRRPFTASWTGSTSSARMSPTSRAGGEAGRRGAPRPYKLTPREMDIVSAIAEGQSNRQIAERLP